MSDRKPFEPLTLEAIDAFRIDHTNSETGERLDVDGALELLDVVNEAIAQDAAYHRRALDVATGDDLVREQYTIILRERDQLREHKQLLLEENGRLLTEKESGLWDANHPLRAQLADAVKVIERWVPSERAAFLKRSKK